MKTDFQNRCPALMFFIVMSTRSFIVSFFLLFNYRSASETIMMMKMLLPLRIKMMIPAGEKGDPNAGDDDGLLC